MTDTFIVDDAGSFVVGKAQTTPQDESDGFMNSAVDALEQWDSSPQAGLPRDRLRDLQRHRDAQPAALPLRAGVGAIVTAGQEDYLRIERGIQTYLGYSYSDRLHLATHHHNEPLVPRERVMGIRGRIDVFGEEILPLRDADAREAAAALLDAGVRASASRCCSAIATRSTSSASRRSSRR